MLINSSQTQQQNIIQKHQHNLGHIYTHNILLTSSLASMSALAANNTFTTFSLPQEEAQWRGVSPPYIKKKKKKKKKRGNRIKSIVLINSSQTQQQNIIQQHQHNLGHIYTHNILLTLFLALTLALASTNTFTTLSCPFREAQWRAV